MITISLLIFDDVHDQYYGNWLAGNAITDCVNVVDILVQSRRGEN
jgi:hypothetical protein